MGSCKTWNVEWNETAAFVLDHYHIHVSSSYTNSFILRISLRCTCQYHANHYIRITGYKTWLIPQSHCDVVAHACTNIVTYAAGQQKLHSHVKLGRTLRLQ